MDFITRDYIKLEVDRAVRERLSPNFFDVIFQELRFKSLTEDAVNKFLPSALHHKLSEHSSIVAIHVNTQVKSILQSTLSEQMTLMARQFDEKVADQQRKFTHLQERHIDELRSASDSLIRTQISQISDNNTVIERIKTHLLNMQNAEISPLIEKINSQERELTTLRNELRTYMIFQIVGFALVIPASIIVYITH